jgi:hypothetical protein
VGRIWDNGVRFFLPDDDVFQIDATQNPPVLKGSSPHVGQPFAHVGTVLFNMAVNPSTGRVYVTNGESHNEVRFEGQRPPCTPLTTGGPTPNSVVGRLSEARITVLDPASGSVTPRHLNKHLDSGPDSYCTVPSPPGTSAASLSTPVDMAITMDGQTLYVAAFGSSDPATPGTGKVGVFSTSALEADTFTPSAASHIVLSAGGASGLALNEAHHRLYVLTRFDDGLSVVDTTTSPGTEVQHLSLFNPEPASVVEGRPFLYDAGRTSTNGEAACASCHIFGDFDSLAWDLGDPDGSVLHNPNPFTSLGPVINPDFHSLKGPMTTQTLRGMVNDGPMHWRGDRTAGNDPGGNPLDSHGAFEKFNQAFVGLTGMHGHCSVTLSRACDDLTPCPTGELCVGLQAADMDAFTNFILQVMLPPNPIRALDNTTLTSDQSAGETFFFNTTADTVATCNGCHTLDPANGHFGTAGISSFENETQDLKIPHLRNAYQKVGMFGMPAVNLINSGNNGTPGPFTIQTDQVRGFGFLHDGSVDTLFRFHNATVFNGGFNPNGGNTTRRQVEQFVLAFPSDLAPIVGQQVTLTSTNSSVAGPRIDLMIQRAVAGECDLTVKGVIKNPSTNVLEQRGWLRLASGEFETDRVSDPLASDAQLRGLAGAAGQELTYTCVAPGDGVRVGVDRDLDGCRDRSELDSGTDPADPLSVPAVCGSAATTTTTSPTTSTTTLTTSTTTPTTSTTTPTTGATSTTTSSTTSTTVGSPSLTLIETRSLSIRDNANPAKRRFSFTSSTRNDLGANHIVPPPAGSAGDPTQNGGELIVYDAAGLTTESVPVALLKGWSPITKGSTVVGWRFTSTDSSSAVSSVVVQADKISVKGGKSGFSYTLKGSPQGSVGVRLLLGAGGWCADAPAKTSGNPPSTARNDNVDKFVAEPNSPAPATCPALPTH